MNNILVRITTLIALIFTGNLSAETFKGKIICPIFGIGGETTGIGFRTETKFYELVVPEKMKESIKKLNGQMVVLEGSVVLLSGVETTNRPAIEVTKALQMSKTSTFTGTVIYPLVGLGGETTGIGLKTNRGLYELVLPDHLKDKALEARDRRAKVVGEVIFLNGVETKNRPAIYVSSIDLI